MSTLPDSELDNILGSAVTYSDPEWGWDHLSLFLGALMPRNDGEPAYRIGTGETVPPSHVRMRARMMFLEALYRLKPETTWELITHHACELMGAYHADMAEWGRHILTLHEQGKDREIPALEDSPPGLAAFMPLHEHISAWQARHRLKDAPDDRWISRAAHFTLTAAYRYREAAGELYDGQLVVRDAFRATVHAGKRTPDRVAADARDLASRRVFRYTPAHELKDVPVYLDDLKHPPYEVDGHELEDDGELGSYDPRTEKVDAAVKRLMPDLEARLRRALEGIEKDDRELNGAIDPVWFRKASRFERLVRYQVLGESLSRIAGNSDRKTLREERDQTAALIGLPLRPPDKGGRPSKKPT